jgi:hypothetical protein
MVVWYYFRPGFLNNQAQFFVFEGSEKKSKPTKIFFQAYKKYFPGLQKFYFRPTYFYYQVNIFGISGNIS